MNASLESVETIELNPGTLFIQEGSTGEYIYYLVEGEMEAVRHHHGQVLGKIQSGDFLGEMSVLADKPATADVITKTYCKVHRFTKDQFFELLENDPQLNRSFLTMLSGRARTLIKVESKQAKVLLVKGMNEVDLLAFIQQLVPKFNPYIHCHQVMNQPLRGLGVEEVRTSLEEFRSEYDWLILSEEAGGPDWTMVLEGRIDHILVVANAEPGKPGSRQGISGVVSEGRESKQEHGLGGSENDPKLSLVLLHPDRSRPPRNTKTWLQLANFGMHYHVVDGDSEDLSRLARCLTGNAFGLVLGGGGVKGSAHVGLIFALQKAGIPIDFMVGTSAGAIMPASIAMGRVREEFYVFVDKMMRLSRKFNDYTFPHTSLVAGKHYTRVIQEYAKDWEIEDLWIPFAAVSTSLKSGKAILHREGPLWKALRASTSIPGIYPPIFEGDDALVDGGLLNNYPLDLIDDFPTGKVIFSDINHLESMPFEGPFPAVLSGWKLLFHRINPFSKRPQPPSVTKLLTRCFHLSTLNQQRAIMEVRPPDLHIKLPVNDLGNLAYKEMETALERAYQYGIEHSGEWRTELGLE